MICLFVEWILHGLLRFGKRAFNAKRPSLSIEIHMISTFLPLHKSFLSLVPLCSELQLKIHLNQTKTADMTDKLSFLALPTGFFYLFKYVSKNANDFSLITFAISTPFPAPTVSSL